MGQFEGGPGVDSSRGGPSVQKQGRVDARILQYYGPSGGVLSKSGGRMGEKEGGRRNPSQRKTRQRGGGVRLVPQDNDSDDESSVQSRSRASSARSQQTIESVSDGGLGISVGHIDTWK